MPQVMIDFKGYDLLNDKLKDSPEFREKFERYMNGGQISYFDEGDWKKILKQNFIPFTTKVGDKEIEINNFFQIFEEGLNIGSCTVTAKQMSYSYDKAALVFGIVECLKGTQNSKDGHHWWFEVDGYIYDTTLLIKFHRSIAKEMGYSELSYHNYKDLMNDGNYSSRKKYVTDPNINRQKRTDEIIEEEYETNVRPQVK